MSTATLTKEITIETPNGTGIAAKVTQLVSQQAKANIRAAWAFGNSNKGHFSLITDNNQKAIEALKAEYPETKENEVLVINVPNSVGKIQEVSTKISQAGLNINYLYTTYFEEKPAIVLSTNDNKKACTLLNQ